MSLYTSLRADLGLTDGVPRAREIDSTAHVGSWSLVVGGAILGCLAVLLLVHAACCQAARRAVHSSDAPELEEVGCLRHVDTVQVRAGKLVSDRSAGRGILRQIESDHEMLPAASADGLHDNYSRRPREKKKKGKRAPAL
ncbi:hypothetical protein AB1Y20_002098 [Prymnesium parvum]|uniref:Uncharacterized protein n=1 Tax=Prymnesium parvum TaxID=97485 RepID=A0AB34J847_PRYPA